MAKTIIEIKNLLEARFTELQETQKKFLGRTDIIKIEEASATPESKSAFAAGRNFGHMEGIEDALNLIDELLCDPTIVYAMNPIK